MATETHTHTLSLVTTESANTRGVPKTGPSDGRRPLLVFTPGARSKATGGVTGERSHYAYSGGVAQSLA